MKRGIIKSILSLFLILFLSACGGGENWGIDHERNILISKCIKKSRNASEANATIALKGSIVSKLSDDAILRVWHFQNGKRAICMISGEAILIKRSKK